MAASVDLKELDAELSRTKKNVEMWAKHRTDAAVHLRDAHCQAMQDQSVKLNSLRAHQASLGASAQQVKKRVEVEELETAALQSSTKSVQQEQLSLQQKVDAFKQQLKLREQECMDQDEAAMLDEGLRKKKINALKRALSLYSSRLGLDFKQGPEELHLVFTQVDPAQPARPFVVGVKILADKTYEVTKCSPPLEVLPDLVSRLNQTNDFSEFVKAVRSSFKV